jgi:hypothetical protein
MEEDEIKISKGFDRDIDFATMKGDLIKCYDDCTKNIDELDENDKQYISKRRILIHRLIYIVICCVQLRSGARIIEAVKAFKLFMKSTDLDKNVTVKLAKSATKKYKDDGTSYITPVRYREIKFPTNWIDIKYQDDMKFYADDIINDKLKKRVLDYLLKYHKCNTHSLRYAYINYMLYVRKKEMGLVAKIIGHSNFNQLVRYTQNRNAKEVFDMEI